jgi:hypothetical protein
METQGQMGHNPIRVIDVTSMFRRLIDENERPYMVSVLKANNKLIDEWEKEILTKICDKNTFIRDGQVLGEWQSFYTGKIIYNFIDRMEKGLLSRPSKTVVDYWVNFFTKVSIEEMMKEGAPLIAHGWKILIDENCTLGMLDKWEQVYSKTTKPLEWRELNSKNPKLWSRESDNHFWNEDDYKKIVEKVLTVIKTPIQPV